VNNSIKEVIITPLKKIEDDRGKIMHMMRNDSKLFKSFGEIYFSTINPGFIKAWHLHKKNTLNYACIKGKVRLVLFDDREKSHTKGIYQEIELSTKNYSLVTIPKNIWNGFINLDGTESIIANCLDFPHDENEMVRKKFDDSYFDYNWKK